MTPRCAAVFWSARSILLALLPVTLILGGLRSAEAVEFGPQSIVRRFCRADGTGNRLSVAGWDEIAPLVDWLYEPAWDHIVLITGYEVGSPRVVAPKVIGVDVQYAVVGQVSALGFDAAVQLETVTFRLDAQAGRWRILGPPPPPHIFNSRADVDSMRRSLEVGGLNFLPNSLFIWNMFRSAGWNVPFVGTPELQSGSVYRTVAQPRPGDVVVYLRDGAPYHAGLLETEDQVVSSTVNFGIVRTATEAFAGEVKYLRLVQPEPPVPTPAVNPPVADAGAAPTPAIHRPRHPAGHARQSRSAKPRRSDARRKRVRKRAAGPTVRPTAPPVPRTSANLPGASNP